jgi:AcrR family transcriptional regulator
MRLRYHNDQVILRQVPRAPIPSTSGRVAQKRRTRNDLLRAAQLLRERGEIPTVARAADDAGISRATAYRYFPTQDVLLAEASAAPLLDEIAKIVARAAPIADPEARVRAVFSEVAPLLLRHEAELRAMLKLALERSLQYDDESEVLLHSSRWIIAWDPLLEPLRSRVSPHDYVLMVRSLSTLLSIDAILVLRDACDGDEQRTIAAITNAARAMLRGFLERLD